MAVKDSHSVAEAVYGIVFPLNNMPLYSRAIEHQATAVGLAKLVWGSPHGQVV